MDHEFASVEIARRTEIIEPQLFNLDLTNDCSEGASQAASTGERHDRQGKIRAQLASPFRLKRLNDVLPAMS